MEGRNLFDYKPDILLRDLEFVQYGRKGVALLRLPFRGKRLCEDPRGRKALFCRKGVASYKEKQKDGSKKNRQNKDRLDGRVDGGVSFLRFNPGRAGQWTLRGILLGIMSRSYRGISSGCKGFLKRQKNRKNTPASRQIFLMIEENPLFVKRSLKPPF